MLFMTSTMHRTGRRVIVPGIKNAMAASTSTKPAVPQTPPPPPPELDRPFGFPSPPIKAESLPTFMQRTKSLFTQPGQQAQILEEEGAS